MSKPTGYVVWYSTQYQDGHDDRAKCFHSLEDALAFINKYPQGGDTTTFQLFEMGREVPVKSRKVEEREEVRVVVKEHIVYRAGK